MDSSSCLLPRHTCPRRSGGSDAREEWHRAAGISRLSNIVHPRSYVRPRSSRRPQFQWCAISRNSEDFWSSHFPVQLTLYQSRLKEILRPRMDASLGIDYGTNSVRALIVDCSNGAELGGCVVDYPSGHHPSGHQGVLLDRANHRRARHGIWGASDHRAHRGVCRRITPPSGKIKRSATSSTGSTARCMTPRQSNHGVRISPR